MEIRGDFSCIVLLLTALVSRKREGVSEEVRRTGDDIHELFHVHAKFVKTIEQSIHLNFVLSLSGLK